MKTSLQKTGFTLIELLVVISIIAILASLSLPAVTGAIAKAQMSQVLSNMKQLHLITQQMALEATSTGDSTIGWPGDIGGKGAWETLVKEELGADVYKKLMSAPGKMNGDAINVLEVKSSHPADTIFLHTVNWSGGSLSGDPFGEKGAVIFQKGGSGVIVNKRQASKPEITGKMPQN
ncbi:MAG: prepilin-type N-terminal cleavage/methylation domain-containing protein [Chthoniobacterales bacterium]|nr:prepilin-type N-terminal cleavage/methylation domain-containing protein [Chthoniobacterales bacterium]